MTEEKRTIFSMMGKVEMVLDLIATESMRKPEHVYRLPGMQHIAAALPLEQRMDLVHGLATGTLEGVAKLCQGQSLEQRTARVLSELHGDDVLTDDQCARIMGLEVAQWLKLQAMIVAGGTDWTEP